jgi:lipoprotein-anchoring transpeptidase ErfK/SrfK
MNKESNQQKINQKPLNWLSAKSGLIYAGLIFVLLVTLSINSLAAAFLEGRIYPNVKVANQDVGLMQRSEVLSFLKGKQIDYNMKISVADKIFDLKTSDFGAKYDALRTAEAAYMIGRSNFAITGLSESVSHGSSGYAYDLDNQKFQETERKIVDTLGKPPVNATLNINDGNIEVVPAQPGLRVDPAQLRKSLDKTFASASNQDFHFDAVESEADIQANDTIDAQNKAKQYMAKKITLDYQGRTFSPTPSDIGHWLVFVPAYNQDKSKTYLDTAIDQAQIKSYVQGVANQINISPVNEKIIIANGTKSKEREGKNGLAVDEDAINNALINSIQANSDLSMAIPANTVQYKTEYNEVVALGYAKYIEVSLSSQHLWAYQDGQVVYSSPLTSGATGAGFPTATGLFSIYYKTTNTHLDGRPFGYNYNVFVQFWMPFHADYGLHDASWRSSFGGQDYYYGGSHGCVNLPYATAAFLYSWSEVGTPVWVHY